MNFARLCDGASFSLSLFGEYLRSIENNFEKFKFLFVETILRRVRIRLRAYRRCLKKSRSSAPARVSPMPL